MPAPTIKTDGISDEQKKTAKFQSAYQDILAQLTAPGFVPVLCAHEAAHAIFFTVAGMKQFDALPARIEYDPQTDDYKGYLAAIQVLDLPPWTPGQFNEWLHCVACAHAAGGVVARKLMPSSDGGDQDDKDRFRKLCNEFNKDPKVRIDFDDWWNSAQKAVSEMLENPAAMADIHKQALALQPMFGL